MWIVIINILKGVGVMSMTIIKDTPQNFTRLLKVYVQYVIKKEQMGNNSAIQWCDATWNIARGCTKVDEDCKFCYMYRESLNGTRYEPKQVTKTKTVFNLPLKLKHPSKIFTSSLTDFFHEDCDSFRNEAWEIIRKCPQHIFQILTKRPERIIEHLPEFWEEVKGHVWLGTSIGNMDAVSRALEMINIRSIAKTLFLSLEPMHEELNFRWSHWPVKKVVSEHELLKQFDWIIIGGESGNENGQYKYRPCKLEWIDLIVTHCKEANVPVFVKQLGTHLAKQLKLKDRHGGDINEWPEHLRIREFPKIENVLNNG